MQTPNTMQTTLPWLVPQTPQPSQVGFAFADADEVIGKKPKTPKPKAKSEAKSAEKFHLREEYQTGAIVVGRLARTSENKTAMEKVPTYWGGDYQRKAVEPLYVAPPQDRMAMRGAELVVYIVSCEQPFEKLQFTALLPITDDYARGLIEERIVRDGKLAHLDGGYYLKVEFSLTERQACGLTADSTFSLGGRVVAMTLISEYQVPPEGWSGPAYWRLAALSMVQVPADNEMVSYIASVEKKLRRAKAFLAWRSSGGPEEAAKKAEKRQSAESKRNAAVDAVLGAQRSRLAGVTPA